MQLTKDILIKIGFQCDHPERPLCNFHLNSKTKPEYRIGISQQYKPFSNKLCYNVDCILCNDKGVIIKHSSLTDVETTEELQQLINLSKIDFIIENE